MTTEATGKLRELPWGTVARFWSKVNVLKVRQCWEWRSYIDPSGYGKMSINGRPHSAHVLASTISSGPIPDGLWIDHICMNRKCVNPAHLRRVTPKISSTENTNGAAARNKNKTHCDNGHPYNEKNTVIKKCKSGPYRRCRVCISEHKKRARLAKVRAAEILSKGEL